MNGENEEKKIIDDQMTVLTIINIILFSIIALILLLVWCVDKVYAKDMYWVQILRNGSGVTDFSNVTEFSYTGTASAFDIHYQLSTQANEQVYMNSSYLVKVFPNTVARREVNAWYKDTNGTWHQVQQYCFDNGTRKQSGIYEEFTENISCQFKTAVATTEFIIRYSYLDSSSNPFNFTILNVVQKSNAFSTQESDANSINANNDKNTNSILNGIDNMGDAINGVIENKSDEITNAIENQYNLCSNYNIQKNSSTKNDDIEGYLYNGNINPNSSYYVTSEYFVVNANKTYNLTLTYQSNTIQYCLYDKEQNLLNCSSYNSNTNVIIIPQQDGYLRFTYAVFGSSNSVLTGTYCYNALEKENEDREEWMNYSHDYGNNYDDSVPDQVHQNETTMTQNLDTNLNGVNINIDTNANGVIWNIINSLLQTNTVVFTMVIALLSIGIIKLVLGR